VDLDTPKAAGVACANRYRRRGFGWFAASHHSDRVFISSFFVAAGSLSYWNIAWNTLQAPAAWRNL